MFWPYTLRQGRMAKEVDLGPKTEETQGPGGGVEKMSIKRGWSGRANKVLQGEQMSLNLKKPLVTLEINVPHMLISQNRILSGSFMN